MRVTTAFKRLVRLDDVNVTAVEFLPAMVLVTVVPCAAGASSAHTAHTSPVPLRHPAGALPLAPPRPRDLAAGDPGHPATAALPDARRGGGGRPFAQPGAHLTRDLADLLAWLATRMDRSAVARPVPGVVAAVGRACERVVAIELDPHRLDGLFRIGVDEISWRNHHEYLTLVVDHGRGGGSGVPRTRTPRPWTPRPWTPSSTSSGRKDRPSSALFRSTSMPWTW